MGKATIISETGAGRYTVRINKDISRITVRIARLTARVVALTAELVSQAAQITTQEAVIAGLTAQIATATLEQLPALEKSLLEARTELDKLNVTKRLTELEKVSCQKTIDYLNGLSGLADETVGAWCADYTEDLTGIVGTMEVPGERGTVLVRPGYNGAAVYSAARDGQLQPVLAGTPASAYWNYCMFPGWQKWKPLWRFGRIVSLSGNTATVDLDSVTSSAQALDINQTNANLTSVPIEYMDCNGGAFIVGDDVVVEFTDQDWAQPKVIGFREEPRPCQSVIVCQYTINGGSNLYTVFDPTTNLKAVIYNPTTGLQITLPCTYSSISAWLATHSNVAEWTSLWETDTPPTCSVGIGNPPISCTIDPARADCYSDRPAQEDEYDCSRAYANFDGFRPYANIEITSPYLWRDYGYEVTTFNNGYTPSSPSARYLSVDRYRESIYLAAVTETVYPWGLWGRMDTLKGMFGGHPQTDPDGIFYGYNISTVLYGGFLNTESEKISFAVCAGFAHQNTVTYSGGEYHWNTEGTLEFEAHAHCQKGGAVTGIDPTTTYGRNANLEAVLDELWDYRKIQSPMPFCGTGSDGTSDPQKLKQLSFRLMR